MNERRSRSGIENDQLLVIPHSLTEFLLRFLEPVVHVGRFAFLALFLPLLRDGMKPCAHLLAPQAFLIVIPPGDTFLLVLRLGHALGEVHPVWEAPAARERETFALS